MFLLFSMAALAAPTPIVDRDEGDERAGVWATVESFARPASTRRSRRPRPLEAHVGAVTSAGGPRRAEPPESEEMTTALANRANGPTRAGRGVTT
jgi:hypothetical protein